jgi:hypothetical protein
MKYINALAQFISREPVATIGVVVAALTLLANYGLPLGGQHALDIKAVAEALIVLVGAYVARSQVSPVAPTGPRPADPPAPIVKSAA